MDNIIGKVVTLKNGVTGKVYGQLIQSGRYLLIKGKGGQLSDIFNAEDIACIKPPKGE